MANNHRGSTRGGHNSNGPQKPSNSTGEVLANQHRIVDRILNAPQDWGFNPGLRYDRYLRLWTSLQRPDLVTDTRSVLENFIRWYAERGQQHGLPLLRRMHQRQSVTTEHYSANFGENSRVWRYTSAEPLALGMGADHPLENGFTFEPVVGVPYLSGSAVKGLIRAANKSVGSVDFDVLEQWLGPEPEETKAGRGALRVFDVYPAEWPILYVDIINSHHSRYYTGGGKNPIPVETESPIPVFFLAAQSRTEWIFRMSGRGLNDQAFEAVGELLKAALAWFGIGGKTAVGYGRMRPDSEKIEFSIRKKPLKERPRFDESGYETQVEGRCIIIHANERAEEAIRLAEALHERGVPTWEVGEARPPIDVVRDRLLGNDTASAVLWLTPEIRNSAIIGNDEIPLALNRGALGDGFFVSPILAGGLRLEQLTDVIGRSSTTYGLDSFGVPRVTHDPATPAELHLVARQVLERRIQALHHELKPDEPIRAAMYFSTSAMSSRFQLAMDWSHASRPDKALTPEIARDRLLPALLDLRNAIIQHASERSLQFTGQFPLPVGTLLGSVFSETSGIDLHWLPPQNPDQYWSIRSDREDVGFIENLLQSTNNGDALALLVAFRRDAFSDFQHMMGGSGRFRRIVTLLPPDDVEIFRFEKPEQAAGLALRVDKVITEHRGADPSIRSLHLFTAVPLGVAVMIGQLLNRLGRVHLYNHTPGEAVPYREAIEYRPNMLDLGLSQMQGGLDDGNVDY
ncbi:MAG: type III-B CRISPR module RAMP protein Cmr6 [Thiotrichales bacterium]